MGATPVPVSVMVCVVPVVELSVMTTLPVCAPRAVGLKVTVMTQLPPAATDDVQVVVSAKGALGGAILETVRAVVVLVFLSVTFLAALVEPTPTEPKETDVAESVTLCACAVSGPAASKKKSVARSTRSGRNSFVWCCIRVIEIFSLSICN